MSTKLSDDDLRHAVHWFSRQREGDAFFAFLRSVLTSIGPVEDTCALHRHEARRTFAADLIAMAEAEKRDGPEDDDARPNKPRNATRKNRRHGPAGR